MTEELILKKRLKEQFSLYWKSWFAFWLLGIAILAPVATTVFYQKSSDPRLTPAFFYAGLYAFLLAQAKALPVSYQITPLLNAVLSEDLKLVQATLAEHPEMLNIAYAQNGNTPLHVAALNGYAEIMQFLLAQPNIDKDRKNNDGKTAFDLSAKRGGTNFSS